MNAEELIRSGLLEAYVLGQASPEEAAQEIIRGFAAGRFEIHFPKRFTLWMKFLKLLPYRLYFRAVHKFTGL